MTPCESWPLRLASMLLLRSAALALGTQPPDAELGKMLARLRQEAGPPEEAVAALANEILATFV